jgi:hypothetical protein
MTALQDLGNVKVITSSGMPAAQKTDVFNYVYLFQLGII